VKVTYQERREFCLGHNTVFPSETEEPPADTTNYQTLSCCSSMGSRLYKSDCLPPLTICRESGGVASADALLYFRGERTKEFFDLKVPRQCSLVLLVEICFS
jgi:hypothetical protein